jgi:hypothetical protein
MISSHRFALPMLLCLGMCLLAGSARASTALGIGADYWVDQGGAFELTLAADTHLARRLTLGGRFGVMMATGPNNVGAPIDLRLRLRVQRVYVEGLAGPWIIFRPDPLRAHAAFGFGLAASEVQLGLEVGWLDPGPLIGLRLGFPL